MRKLLFFLILLPLSTPLYSQWGIKGGINSADIKGTYYATEGIVTLNFGVTYDYQLSNNWYFQPSLLFTTVGFNIEESNSVIKNGQVKIHAFEIPFNLSYRPKIYGNTRLITDFGLFGRYGLFGKLTYEYQTEISSVDENPFNVYNRFDMGINLGVGLQIKQYYGIISYHRGLTNAEKDVGYYHEVFRFSLGYFF